MSADVLNDNSEPEVWSVHGINWSLDVPLDKYNSEFDAKTQAYEAASIAVYVFRGEPRDLFITLDEGETEPLLGPTMIVFKRGTDPNNGYIPFTHEILANCGFYPESIQMEKVLNESILELEAEQTKNQELKKQIAYQVKKLKNSLRKKA